MVAKSVILVVIWAILKALRQWWRACVETCQPDHLPDEESGDVKEDTGEGRSFIVVEFNAWECVGSDLLWAAVVSKIFDAVSRWSVV